jgi:hypothetical protein
LEGVAEFAEMTAPTHLPESRLDVQQRRAKPAMLFFQLSNLVCDLIDSGRDRPMPALRRAGDRIFALVKMAAVNGALTPRNRRDRLPKTLALMTLAQARGREENRD